MMSRALAILFGGMLLSSIAPACCAQIAPGQLAQDQSQSSGTGTLTIPAAPVGINADTAAHEVEVFAGGGIELDGFNPGYGVWNAGVRYGWLLTDRHSDRFYSNRFEFAVEVAPLFVVYQSTGTAYGFNFYAFALKWNFTPHHRIAPFFEMAGGAVVTTREVPEGVGKFNFTPTATLGVRILRGKYAWSIGARWLHISDAGITYLNPGNDSIGIRVSLSRFLK
jgi:hypothetical protein